MSLARNMSRINVDNNGYVQPSSLSRVDGSVISSRIPHSSMPSGSSIQLVSSLYQWYNSITATTSWQAVPGISAIITPKYSNSKIKVEARWFGEVSGAWDVEFGFTRNGTLINLPTNTGSRYPALGMPVQTYIADDNNSTPELSYITTLDTPGTTNAVTYNLVCLANGARTLITGKVFDTGNGGSNYEQGSCEIVLTEYAP